jgi:hypothetical protein
MAVKGQGRFLDVWQIKELTDAFFVSVANKELMGICQRYEGMARCAMAKRPRLSQGKKGMVLGQEAQN